MLDTQENKLDSKSIQSQWLAVVETFYFILFFRI